MKKNNNNEDVPAEDAFLHVLRYDIWLKILTSISIILIISGFCVPPTGVIDGSVLIGTGELAGFGALFELGHAIDKGLDAKVKIKDIELQVHNDELEEQKLDEQYKEEINIED